MGGNSKAGCTFALYRIFGATGELFYIGATTNPATRLQAHARSRTWWGDVSEIRLEHFATVDDLIEAEAEAIKAEEPKYNIIHSAKPFKPRPRTRKRGEGSVYYSRLDGRWVGAVTVSPGADGKQRRRVVHGKDRETAERKVEQLLAELADEEAS